MEKKSKKKGRKIREEGEERHVRENDGGAPLLRKKGERETSYSLSLSFFSSKREMWQPIINCHVIYYLKNHFKRKNNYFLAKKAIS